MKRKFFALVLVTLITMVFAVGCGSTNNSTSGTTQAAGNAQTTASAKKLKVTFLGAQFGDKSYWDGAKRGVEEAGQQYKDKIDVNVVDMGTDRTKWKEALQEACDGDSDLIITGTFDQEENLQDIASQYPDKQFILFDDSVNYTKYDCKNVYSIGYSANQSGYLAGMVGAYMTTSKNQGINPDKAIGFVGGMDNTPIINDFLVGYIYGAKAVTPDIKVAVSYVGSFTDSAKAKELALAQINSQNVDVVFSCAGSSGTGAIEAASDSGKYVIGVDSDQSVLYDGRKEQSAIVTSALKNVDKTLVKSIGEFIDGKLPVGKYEVLGINDDAIGLVENDLFKKYVDSSFIDKIHQAEGQLKDGTIKIPSAFDMTEDQVKQLIQTVQ